MTETELRIAGAEKLLVAIAPWLSDRAVLDAMATLRADLVASSDPDERFAAMQALQLLSDGVRRFESLDIAAWIKQAPAPR